MITLAVDLAPRHSGIVVLADTEVILAETVDVGPETDGFELHAVRMSMALENILNRLLTDGVEVDLGVVEDVSFRMVKPGNALRLQGFVRWYLFTRFKCDMLCVMPSVWQTWWHWKKKPGVTSKGFSSYTAKALGYTFDGVKGKAATDLNDAVLIARWAYETNKDKYE